MRGAPTSRKNSCFGVRFANELSASRTQPRVAFAMLVLIRRRWPIGDQRCGAHGDCRREPCATDAKALTLRRFRGTADIEQLSARTQPVAIGPRAAVGELT